MEQLSACEQPPILSREELREKAKARQCGKRRQERERGKMLNRSIERRTLHDLRWAMAFGGESEDATELNLRYDQLQLPEEQTQEEQGATVNGEKKSPQKTLAERCVEFRDKLLNAMKMESWSKDGDIARQVSSHAFHAWKEIRKSTARRRLPRIERRRRMRAAMRLAPSEGTEALVRSGRAVRFQNFKVRQEMLQRRTELLRDMFQECISLVRKLAKEKGSEQ